jgi:hypothetical protein
MSDMNDAKAPVRFAILNELIAKGPRASHPYLDDLADIAAAAVEDPATAWAFVQVAEAARPKVEALS